ncbi:phosphatase [Sulfurimicrobium lacus]|uniref:Phosphatase n=1 Tax=Sulfurimicrobium lacus TaxID=2715678 RepID=A0A6F8VDX8_9PROT|nr:3',5'-nucleoside bisphosphate phosphatase [Sulfurimicrobium lacus]BCB27884.1 phosphatase [Sulfurimicrobium lacus]
MPKIDLHSHSTVSDGTYTPTELVRYAAAQGVEVMALTDHDDLGGLDEARVAAEEQGIRLVNGVEISVSWNGRTIHIVGLHVDPAHAELQAGLENIRAGRLTRAVAIAAELDKVGISGSLEGARAYAHERILSRTHFARFLVANGHAKDVKTVFKKFLVKGKPGHVSHRWADMAEAIGWIKSSGGIAVLAHPGRYDIGKMTLHALFAAFKEAGGEAVEVVSGSHTPDQYRLFAEFAKQYGLLSSAGSDYHGPAHNYFDMGRLPPLPAGCEPVWEHFEF